MTFAWPDQQPIARTVGRRTQAPVGVPPSAEARAALDSWANRLTRAPKGVFRYASHEDMERDRYLWQTRAIVETQRSRTWFGKTGSGPKDEMDAAAIARALEQLGRG
jgi:hypothetical protein